MSRYRPMRPGEKRPCWKCNGRKTIQVNRKVGGKPQSVTEKCDACNGKGTQ